MAEALILINVEVGTMEKVFERIKKMEQVQRSAMITGPYDIMALAQGRDIEEISQTLMKKIRKIGGVKETTTCVEIE
ncbi:hypothetical protein AKJ62_01250 [candidate division MSBL1 archaeon SCGC-AAA259D14]|uniref:Transcription regulator AsnC/Lrp ligand binding domain-containing protein n=1 Tax=candidate division MSBL1 archaeon SCGC-AAA259D14 TaxID=1698261 RepID=A0A133U7V2_9EURY|nr:hypothetical protein AKJ62_01250 [candidate division MSBL1 archaeon SCGC-AAA259D14]